LHRADDVDLFHLRTSACASRRRDNGGVYEGVDFGRLQDLNDQRVSDVRAHELRARQLDTGRLEVDAENLADVGVLLESAREMPAEEPGYPRRSEEHTSELQSPCNLVCRLLLEKKNGK